MHVIYCMCDSKLNEQVSPHNIGFCITTPLTSPPNSRRCCLIGSFWNSVIISCYCPPCLAPALHPHSLLPVNLFFPFPRPPPTTQRSLQFIIGKKGDGDECRGQESMKGREKRGGGTGSNRERKMIVCACVSGNSTPWQIQCRCHWSCLEGEGELISLVLWRCTHALHENSSSLIYLIHISLLASSSSSLVFRNVFFLFPFWGGIIFLQDKGHWFLVLCLLV